MKTIPRTPPRWRRYTAMLGIGALVATLLIGVRHPDAVRAQQAPAGDVCAPQASDRVAFWRFEGSGATVLDATAYNNEGVLHNGATRTVFGPPVQYTNTAALLLDGSDDFVRITDVNGLPEGDAARTIALWMRPASTGTLATLLALGTSADTDDQKFLLEMADVNGTTYLFSDGVHAQNNITLSGAQVPALQTWHHVAFVYDGGGTEQWHAYIDGQSVGSGAFAVPIDTVTDAVEIGSRHDGPYEGYFDGALDEVQIWDRALTHAEVMRLAEGCVAAWDFGDAPDPSYPTVFASDGARHRYTATGSVRLGTLLDTEPDGQSSSDALGDDMRDQDDEDGVFIAGDLPQGGTGSVTMHIHGTGARVDAWIDFNRDGDWNDAGEQVVTDQAFASGAHMLTLAIPPDAQSGATFSRWRVSTAGGLEPTGEAMDGEVEDYRVQIAGGEEPGNGTPTCNGIPASIYVDDDGRIVGGDDNGDTYRGRLRGTDAADVIVGTDENDRIDGDDGADVLCGRGGEDRMRGDDGSDWIDGGAGGDDIRGDDGDDTVVGSDGDDELRGGDGNDWLDGGAGSDDVRGDDGNDVVRGGSGDDALQGRDGNDLLCAAEGDDAADGGDGNDSIGGGDGSDTVDGGDGIDACAGESTDECETVSPSIAAC